MALAASDGQIVISRNARRSRFRFDAPHQFRRRLAWDRHACVAFCLLLADYSFKLAFISFNDTYATSQRIDALHPGEFSITRADREAFALAGLSFDTKFDLAHVIELPFSDRWFGVPPGAPHGQTPKLGVLHPTMVRRAAAAHRAAGK
jgi:hypothetical protein